VNKHYKDSEGVCTQGIAAFHRCVLARDEVCTCETIRDLQISNQVDMHARMPMQTCVHNSLAVSNDDHKQAMFEAAVVPCILNGMYGIFQLEFTVFLCVCACDRPSVSV
jgi:hypothetical protein